MTDSPPVRVRRTGEPASSQYHHPPSVSASNTQLVGEVTRLTALLSSCEADAQRVINEALSTSQREAAVAQSNAQQLASVEERMKNDRSSYESHMNDVVLQLRSELEHFRDAALRRMTTRCRARPTSFGPR